MQEKVCNSGWDFFDAVQTRREELKIRWEDFEELSGMDRSTVLKWGGRKQEGTTKSVLKALKALGMEIVVRPARKEGKRW